MTDKIEEIRARHSRDDRWRNLPSMICPQAHDDRALLLAEVDRHRAEIERLTRERDNAREAVEFLTKDLSQRFAIRYQTSAGCMCPAEANLHCQNSFCPRRSPPGVITCQGGKP